MIAKKNLMRILEKLPDDVELELCIMIQSDDSLEEIYATLENVNFEDLNQHNIVYLEGTE